MIIDRFERYYPNTFFIQLLTIYNNANKSMLISMSFIHVKHYVIFVLSYNSWWRK